MSNQKTTHPICPKCTFRVAELPSQLCAVCLHDRDATKRREIFDEVLEERHRQDTKWGHGHDDKHGIDHLALVLMKHVGRLTNMILDRNQFGYFQIRKQFVLLAAVCFAAVESIDRRAVRSLDKKAGCAESCSNPYCRKMCCFPAGHPFAEPDNSHFCADCFRTLPSKQERREEKSCPACGGSGSIDTGNNDLLCECPAGDTALFSGGKTGAQVRATYNSPYNYVRVSGPLQPCRSPDTHLGGGRAIRLLLENRCRHPDCAREEKPTHG